MSNSLKPFRRLLPRALGAWLALAFVLLSIVLTLVLTAVIERKSSEQVETNIGHGLAELAMQTSDKLERGMFERYREVGLLARRRSIGEDQPPALRRATLDAIQSTLGYYSWLGYAGLDGKVQVSAQGMLEGADVSRRPWFRNALRGIHAGDVHEAVLLARLLPRQPEPWRFVDVAFPYVDEHGVTRGVLGAHLSWQWARDVERSVMAGITARRQVEALIVDAEGDVLLGPPDVAGKRLMLPSLKAARAQRGDGYLVETWPDGRSYLVGFQRGRGYAEYPGLGWTVLVRQNVDDAFAPVRRLREYGLGAGVLLAALFSLVGAGLARHITRPLGELADAARRIRAGEHVRIEVKRGGYAEVRALGHTLNALVANLVRRRRALEDLNATLEERVALRTRELEQALARVRANEQRIAAIIETAQDAFVGVLDLQKLDAGAMVFDREVQPLLPLAEDAVAAMRGVAGQAGIALSCVAAPGAEGARVDVDGDRLAQVLTNLLSNAIKFSGPGSTVRTHVEARGDRARLAVADEGVGIPEAFRDRVFQRFAQGDGADSRRQGGTGLGLSICKTIVEELGGDIWFDSAEGIGTTFYVELPLAA